MMCRLSAEAFGKSGDPSGSLSNLRLAVPFDFVRCGPRNLQTMERCCGKDWKKSGDDCRGLR